MIEIGSFQIIVRYLYQAWSRPRC